MSALLLLLSMMFGLPQVGYGQTVILDESFSLCTAGAPNGGATSTDIAGTAITNIPTDKIAALNGSQWSGSKVYEAGGSLKMGAGSATGIIITPTLDFTGNAVLTFKSMAWSGDTTRLNISISSGTVEPSSITDLPNGTDYTFRSYTVKISDVTEPCKITFKAGTKNKAYRFFLDDVKVETLAPPTVTISPSNWDGGYATFGALEYPGYGPDFEISLQNVTEDINVTIEPNSAIYLDASPEATVITAGKTSASFYTSYNNLLLGDNIAKLVLKGAVSGNIYGEATMKINGIDPSLPVEIFGIADLKLYASGNLSISNITLQPKDSNSPITITANDGFNTLYIQDKDAAYMIMDSGDLDQGTPGYIIGTAKIGDVLSNIKLELESVFFNITAMPTVISGTPIAATPTTITELNTNPDLYQYKLVMIKNVAFEPGDPMQWTKSSIKDKDGNKIEINTHFYEHATASSDINVSGIYFTQTMMGLSNIAPRNASDFVVPATITNTMPAIVPASGSEFEITLNLGGYEVSPTNLKIEYNDKTVKLQSQYENYQGDMVWNDLYPYNGSANLWLYASDFKDGIYKNKFRAIPLASGERTIRIFGIQNNNEIASCEASYNVTDPIPYIDIVAPTELYGSPAVDLGEVIVGETATATFTVTPHNLSSDLSLSLGYAQDNGLSISPTTISKDETSTVTVTVSYSPTGGPSIASLSDYVKIKDGGLVNEVDVRITGKSINPNAPMISFEPNRLIFEDVNIGQSKTMPVTLKIKNTTLPIEIGLLSGGNPPAFTFSPAVVSPSMEEIEVEINITFTPYEDKWGNTDFYGSISAKSDEFDMVTCSVEGFGVFGDIEPSITITPNSWDGGYDNIENNYEDGTYGPDFMFVLRNITEDVAPTIDPEGVFFLDPNAPSYIPAGQKTSGTTVRYKNFAVGENRAMLVLKGVESGKIYAEASMIIRGVDVNEPVVIKGIEDLKRYAANGSINIAEATLEPKNPRSPITITANNGDNTIFVQDVDAACSIMDVSIDEEWNVTHFITETAKIGDVLSNIRIKLEYGFPTLIDTPTITAGTPIQAEPVTIAQLTGNMDVYADKLVVVNNVNYIPGSGMMEPGKIVNSDGEELGVNTQFYEEGDGAEGINLRGIFLKPQGWNPTSIAPRNELDFITPATLVSTLPASIPAGEITEFELIFTAGSDIYEEFEFSISAINGEDVILERYETSGNEEGYWDEISLQWGGAYINAGTFESKTLKFRITPLSTEPNELSFSAISFVGVGPGSSEVLLASTVSAYSTTGTVPSVTINSHELRFGSVEMGKTKQLTFTVTPKDLTSDLVISLSEGTEGFTVTPTSIPNSTTSAVTVTVTFAPTVAQSYWGAVRITEGGLLKSKMITLMGDGFDPSAPRIETSTSDLSFGDVQNGTTKSMTFTVTPFNLTAPLSLMVNNPAFTLSPATIAVGASETTVTVTFAPTKQDTYYGSLEINGADFVEMGGQYLFLSGNGIGASIPNINVAPLNLVFSAVINTPVPTQTVTIDANDLSEDITITISGTNANLFSFTKSELNWDNRVGGDINVKYSPTAIGDHTAIITVASGSISKTINIIATTTATAEPSINVSATSFSFSSTVGVASAAQVLTVTTVHITEEMNVTITGTDAAMFSRTFDGWIATQGGKINIVYTPTAAGNHTATLTIKSGSVTQNVTLNGIVPGSPVINVDKTELEFQTYDYGVTTAQIVMVSASDLTADMTITITGEESDDFEFSLDGWNAKTGGNINVTFAPRRSTKSVIFVSNATLVITSGNVTKEVALKGNNHLVSVNELADNANIFAFNKTIKVELNNIEGADISVFDISGRMVANKTSESQVTVIDLNTNAGTYIVRVSANGNVVNKKVIIK